MPRFVILEHNTPPGHARPRHFDFMLERENVLWTWALPALPSKGLALEAERLPDHRLTYLDYEGQISGNRGTVQRCEAGEFSWLHCDESAGQLRLELLGNARRGTDSFGTLRGIVTLTRQSAQRWTLLLGTD